MVGFSELILDDNYMAILPESVADNIAREVSWSAFTAGIFDVDSNLLKKQCKAIVRRKPIRKGGLD